ncbi:hypothetical protein B0H16DRAFT_829805 [Mycena metata]|uniref:Uncharacterized protein n=1 Tax=Mycena metata TaxID=1033252 RepID=A0AAD7IYK6_9AGAR|nr:hypothetical protein B0H16DRAFT_829805 [Mycena metata]
MRSCTQMTQLGLTQLAMGGALSLTLELFFPSSRNFVIEGGVFTSNTNVTHHHHTYPASDDFRKIPMGEIDLQHEIRFGDGPRVVIRRRGPRRAQRMFSARIDGCKTPMTVAWYQGPNAKERQDISMHSWLLHPNFAQLCGVASTGSMHAAVFHDDLIPLEQFVDVYRNSLLLSRYFRACWSKGFDDVNNHLRSMFNRGVSEYGCTQWIWGSNRRLCVDNLILNESPIRIISYLDSLPHWRPGREDIDLMSYNGPNHEGVVISSLALSSYYEFCRYSSSR